MHFEYQALAFMTILFLLAWFPASVAKGQTFGTKWLMSNRTLPAGKELPAWGARCERAYTNLKDYYPGFIVAILLLGILGKFDSCTQWAAGIYVAARVVHFVSYTAGNFPIRAFGFFLGLICNILLLIKILI